jgi:hypothetical protein
VARGARLRIVAGREIVSSSCHPVGAIYVRRDQFPNGLADLRPLKGARISTMGSLGGITHYALDALLKHSGMTPDDVQVLRIGPAESAAALLSGGVRAVISRETDLEARPDGLQLVRGPALADIEPGFQYSWIVFGQRLLDGDVRAGGRFLHAYLRGGREFLRGRTPAFLDELARSQGQDPAKVRAGCRDTFDHDGAIHLDHLERFVRWAAAKGFCPKTLEAKSLVDTRFLAAMQGAANRG